MIAIALKSNSFGFALSCFGVFAINDVYAVLWQSEGCVMFGYGALVNDFSINIIDGDQ